MFRELLCKNKKLSAEDCIHVLKDQLKIMAEKMVELSNTTRE